MSLLSPRSGFSESVLIEKTPKLVEKIRDYITGPERRPLTDEEVDEVLEKMRAIKAYANEDFPGLDLLSLDEMCVLTLSLKNPNVTPEASFVRENDDYVEVRRLLSRFYCLDFLVKDDEKGYEKFIECQDTKDPYLPVLSEENYKSLSSQFKDRAISDPVSLDCLKTARLIAAVPLSSEAKKVADRLYGEKKYVIDSVEFPAKVFENFEDAKQVYPFIKTLLEKYPEHHKAIEFNLSSCFPHRTHFRHQLYTEGNASMFTHFVEGVRKGRVTRKTFEINMAHWKLDLIGFRAQARLSLRGSRYLTEHTYNWAGKLETLLSKVFEDESITPLMILNCYLEERARDLKLEEALGAVNQKRGEKFLEPINLTSEEFQILAHLAALLRLYDPQQGNLLIDGYQHCQDSVKTLLPLYFDADPSQLTPTYVPAFFANIIACREKHYDQDSIVMQSTKHGNGVVSEIAKALTRALSTADAVIAALPVYLEALSQYKIKRAAAKEAAEKGDESAAFFLGQPLCFANMAGVESISNILGNMPIIEKFDILERFDIVIGENKWGAIVPIASSKETLDKLHTLLGEEDPLGLRLSPNIPSSHPMLGGYLLQQKREKEEEEKEKTSSLVEQKKSSSPKLGVYS